MSSISKPDSDVPDRALTATGHCTCAHHHFTIHGAPSNVANCHCQQCRRHSGMAFSTWFTVSAERYEGDLTAVLSGSKNEEPNKHVIAYTTALSERLFCAHCGSPVLMRYFVTPETLHVPLGLLEAPSGDEEAIRRAYRPRQDIWTSSRAWWLTPPTDEGKRSREQYEEDDPEFMELCEKWKAEHPTGECKLWM